MESQRSYIHKPSRAHKYSVILLHGRGSTATEFANEFFESQASDDRTLLEIYPSVKWIFLESGMRKSERFGTDLSQWFDMWSTEEPHEKEQDLSGAGIRDAIPLVVEAVRQEARLVSSQRIFIGGISQGCATAIHALLYKLGDMRLGGFVGFSSWLPFQHNVVEQKSAEIVEEKVMKTPVFLAHCKDDNVIAIVNGEKLRDSLLELGMAVTWHDYGDGGHWINEPQGIDDVVAFFDRSMGEAVKHT